jgi:branched-chain amino acid transport system substrate-binding protein
MLRKLVAFSLLLQFTTAWSAEPIKIAVLTALSGPGAIGGEGQVKGFHAAADYTNSEGGVLGGRRIEIVPLDHKANPQEALILLKRVIDEDILYVASTVSSVVHALSEAVAKHNARNPDKSILLLNFGSLDPALTEAKCNFWHFRFEPHTDMQLTALISVMAASPSIKKVYLINQDYAYGQSVSRGAREQLAAKRPDITIVGDELIPLLKIKDFAPYVSKIRASGADSVLTGNWGSDLTLLLKASNEAGLPVNYYANLASLFGTASAIGAITAERIKTVSSWHINAADSEWEKILLQSQREYKTNLDLAYINAFRTVQMVGVAMNKVGSTDPGKVAHALEGLHLAGPTGDAWMRPEDHQLIAPIYLMSYAKAGTTGVKHDIEATGFGWKTDALIDANTVTPPVKCHMERPERSL